MFNIFNPIFPEIITCHKYIYAPFCLILIYFASVYFASVYFASNYFASVHFASGLPLWSWSALKNFGFKWNVWNEILSIFTFCYPLNIVFFSAIDLLSSLPPSLCYWRQSIIRRPEINEAPLNQFQRQSRPLFSVSFPNVIVRDDWSFTAQLPRYH